MYLLFGGETHYPKGGGNDYLNFTDTLNDAKILALQYIGAEYTLREDEGWDNGIIMTIEWVHIFCTVKMTVINRYGGTPYGEENRLNE